MENYDFFKGAMEISTIIDITKDLLKVHDCGLNSELFITETHKNSQFNPQSQYFIWSLVIKKILDCLKYLLIVL